MITDIPHCPAPGEIIVVSEEEHSVATDALTFVLEPFQPLREQFIAITGIGLEEDEDEEARAAALRRLRRPVGAEGTGLSLLAAGPPNGQRVIFVHGSPGLGEEWATFLSDVPTGRLYMAPDRPGYGGSGAEPVTDLQAQADALQPLLGDDEQAPVFLVGYSYGGPVALRLAADRPDRVAGVLLIGAAADPGLEEIHPLQEIAALELFEQMLPSELVSSNAELMSLREGLERLAPDLSELRMPITIVQGTSDTLVPPENVDYLRAVLPASPASVMVEDADHFLPWTHPDLLIHTLDCLLREAARHGSAESSSDR